MYRHTQWVVQCSWPEGCQNQSVQKACKPRRNCRWWLSVQRVLVRKLPSCRLRHRHQLEGVEGGGKGALFSII